MTEVTEEQTNTAEEVVSEEDIKELLDVSDDFPFPQMGFITRLAGEIFGDDFGFNAYPMQDDEDNLVTLIVGSLKYEDVSIQAVFKLTEQTLGDVRKALISFAMRMYGMEQAKEKEDEKTLIVPPEKEIWLPNNDK